MDGFYIVGNKNAYLTNRFISRTNDKIQLCFGTLLHHYGNFALSHLLMKLLILSHCSLNVWTSQKASNFFTHLLLTELLIIGPRYCHCLIKFTLTIYRRLNFEGVAISCTYNDGIRLQILDFGKHPLWYRLKHLRRNQVVMLFNLT